MREVSGGPFLLLYENGDSFQILVEGNQALLFGAVEVIATNLRIRDQVSEVVEDSGLAGALIKTVDPGDCLSPNGGSAQVPILPAPGPHLEN